MSSFRSILFKDIGVKRLWNAWTRGYRFSYMVRRCRRERTVREVFQYFRQTFFKPRRTLLMSVTAAYNSRSEETTDCNVGISDDELEGLLSDVESVKELIKVTVQCKSCSKRVVIDKKQTGVQYCDCEDGHPAEDSSDGWVPFMEAEDVIIWRKEYKTGQGLYAYKVYGRYPEVSARDFAAVQLDGAYRRAWDAAVAALAVVQRHALGVPGQAVLHWEVLWPRLFANRDYVYIRRHKEFDSFVETQEEKRQLMGERERVDNKVYVIVSKSCEHPDVPETRHAIRVMEYWSHMVVKTIEGVEKNGMEFVLTYYDEPARGGMPAGVAAWATGRAAPGYLARMRSAALHYRAWAAATPHQRQEMPDFTPFDPELVDEQQKNASSQISEQDMETREGKLYLTAVETPKEAKYLLCARRLSLGNKSANVNQQRSLRYFGEVRASEGSFFPPRAVTKSDLVYVYDKDLCRILPLQYRNDIYKDGIKAGLYTPPNSTLECARLNPDNRCYCEGEECPPRGLQNISPCQYNAPVYLSYPHFYDADPTLLEPFEGLKPDKKRHETYFYIQDKIGVPLEGFVRVQMNLKVNRAPNIKVNNIHKFPDMMFPVMWIEEGIHEVTPSIWRWIFLATTVGPIAAPLICYSMIFIGLTILITIFVKAYKNFVIGQNSIEIMELGKETLRRSSLLHGSHKLHNMYQPLNQSSTPNESLQELKFVTRPEYLSRSLDELNRSGFVKSNFCLERESLIDSDNSFILSEHRRCRVFKLPDSYFS